MQDLIRREFGGSKKIFWILSRKFRRTFRLVSVAALCIAILRLRLRAVSVAYSLACPAAGKFSRASSAGGRLNLQKNLASQIVSVAEDCLSPERTFHGCLQITPLDASACRFGVIMLFIFRSSKFSRAFACVPSRWKVLSGEFRRRPTELAKEFSKPDRVGRRGLSESQEDFSRLLTNHTARRFCPSIWRNHALQIP